jgi:hypothetical protein
MKHRVDRIELRMQLGENDMTTRENVSEPQVFLPTTTTGHAVCDALRKFLSAPSTSNKVAAVVALQAYFAEVERTSACEAAGAT